METLPLLFFPRAEAADRGEMPSGFGGKIQTQTANKQWRYLSPKFDALLKNIEFQQSAIGTEPEQVLVLELIGNIKDFANAVKKIDGLESLGEIETDDIVPDDRFFDEKYPKNSLDGKIYMIMSNQKGLKKMLSIWKKYSENPNMEFERGFTKFRDVFLQLKDIRKWEARDRFDESGISEVWKSKLEKDTSTKVRFEAELWYRKNSLKREQSEQELHQLVNEHGGNIITSTVIEEIAYHAVLGEIPAQVAEKIIKNRDISLLKYDGVMFFRPTGQMAAEKISNDEATLSEAKPSDDAQPNGDPVVALLDGYPLQNHILSLLQTSVRNFFAQKHIIFQAFDSN